MIDIIYLAEIEEAHERIADMVKVTPVMTSRTLDKRVDAKVYLKCESFQRGGAFKFRGACNFLLSLDEEERENGVIAYSSGNHAQAVALASSLLDIECRIVMPRNAPRVKAEATKGYGAKVLWAGNDPVDRLRMCGELAEKEGYVIVPPFDDERVMAGAGTATLELVKEVGELDHLFCPIGGGGLIGGNATAFKGLFPSGRVTGVEPEAADDAYRSLRDDRIYPSDDPDTIADGLRPSLSELTFSVIKEKVDWIELVTEEEIVEAMRFLMERMKLVVEPSGAVALAGLIRVANADALNGERVGVIVSGGNVDLDDLFEALVD